MKIMTLWERKNYSVEIWKHFKPKTSMQMSRSLLAESCKYSVYQRIGSWVIGSFGLSSNEHLLRNLSSSIFLGSWRASCLINGWISEHQKGLKFSNTLCIHYIPGCVDLFPLQQDLGLSQMKIGRESYTALTELCSSWPQILMLLQTEKWTFFPRYSDFPLTFMAQNYHQFSIYLASSVSFNEL